MKSKKAKHSNNNNTVNNKKIDIKQTQSDMVTTDFSKKQNSQENVFLKNSNSKSTSVISPANLDYRLPSNHKYYTISVYSLIVIVLSALFIFILYNLGTIGDAFLDLLNCLSSFIAAFFIAYFLNPIVKLIDKHVMCKLFKKKSQKFKNILSILLAYILFIGCVILLLTFILPQISESIVELSDKIRKNLPSIYANILVYIDNLNKRFPNLDFSSMESKLKELLPNAIKFFSDYAPMAVTNIVMYSISIVKAFISILLSIVISCYMISDKHIMLRNATKLVYAIFKKDKARAICETAKECNSIFYKFVIGKALDSLIISLITLVAMLLLQLDYPILISLIVGITNMIPYFGPFIGAVPGSIILLIVSPIKGLIFIILIFIIQQFDGLYLGPKILGESVGLGPFWIIFAITVGGYYFSVLGMFLGVPVTAVVTYLLKKFIDNRLRKHNVSEADFKALGVPNPNDKL